LDIDYSRFKVTRLCASLLVFGIFVELNYWHSGSVKTDLQSVSAKLIYHGIFLRLIEFNGEKIVTTFLINELEIHSTRIGYTYFRGFVFCFYDKRVRAYLFDKVTSETLAHSSTTNFGRSVRNLRANRASKRS